jgi:hypothetical protein
MKISSEAAMEHGLSKEQQEILIRAEKKSNEEILASVGSTLLSLVELGLMVKSRPGEYHLTEKGIRVAQSLAVQDSVFLRP